MAYDKERSKQNWKEWGEKKELFKKTGSTVKKIAKKMSAPKVGQGKSNYSDKNYNHN